MAQVADAPLDHLKNLKKASWVPAGVHILGPETPEYRTYVQNCVDQAHEITRAARRIRQRAAEEKRMEEENEQIERLHAQQQTQTQTQT